MSKWRLGVVILVALAVIIPTAAFAATSLFDDVPDGSIFVADINWMKENGVTKGCNPPANTKYCPENNVTRQQMAAFMHRLAVNQVVDAGTVEGFTADELVGASGPTNVYVVMQSYTAPAGHPSYDATLMCYDAEHGYGILLSGGYGFDDPTANAYVSRPYGQEDNLSPMYPLPGGWRLDVSKDVASEVTIDMWVVCQQPTP